MIHVAAALLTLPDGRFVMQRRGNVAFAPLKLGFFGARVEEGETPEAAVLRGLTQKTTLDVTGLQPVLVHTIDIPAEDVQLLVYKIDVPNADFQAITGRAQVHTLHDLRSRIDLTPSLQHLVAVL